MQIVARKNQLERVKERRRLESEGIVLLAMLWVLVALTLLALSLASTTRAEAEVAVPFVDYAST